jgi:hypothetical protein
VGDGGEEEGHGIEHGVMILQLLGGVGANGVDCTGWGLRCLLIWELASCRSVYRLTPRTTHEEIQERYFKMGDRAVDWAEEVESLADKLLHFERTLLHGAIALVSLPECSTQIRK